MTRRTRRTGLQADFVVMGLIVSGPYLLIKPPRPLADRGPDDHDAHRLLVKGRTMDSRCGSTQRSGCSRKPDDLVLGHQHAADEHSLFV
jgi:hypothetical protein